MKKTKIIIFFILIIILIFILLLGIFGSSISFLSVEEIKENRKLKKDLISELTINNVDTVYDKNNNIYYYTISDEYKNKNYVLKLELDNGFKYKIINETLNVINVNYNKILDVIIYNNKYYYETKIQLTNLPLINIETDTTITDNDAKTIFNYVNSNTQEKSYKKYANIHVRGATSKNFEKKSYKINFTNKEYNDEKKVNISNFYYGDSLILDAVYRDPSKIRNVLSAEIWNNISKDFTDVSIYSEFVELFINNEYKGLYVLTEPINRSKLNLNKSTTNNTSIVLKSTSWTFIEKKKKTYGITDDIYLDYELKYPNDSNLYEKSWDSILYKLSKYYNNSDSYETINDTFNINNYIDIIIYNAFINNKDNDLIKNNYFYMNNLNSEEVFIQPWDMEYTFGTIFSNSDSKNVHKNMDDYKIIYTKFEHDSDKINLLLIERYWDLRDSVLTKENFDNLLDKYINDLNKGAALRDANKWYEYDVEKEIEEIRIWIYNRLDYFDDYVKGLKNV